MTRLRWLILILLVCLWTAVLLPRMAKPRFPLFKPPQDSCRIVKPFYKDRRLAMGTFVEVSSSESKAIGIAFTELRRIEKLLSRYDPQSEISRLNREGRIKASPETFYCVKKAIEFYRMSGGAFDITVAPLLDIWGFTDKKFRVPSWELIQKNLKLIGSDKIILNPQESVIEFKLPGMKVDLGAIAKGYAVDCAAARLKQEGITSCLINAGGDIYCLGENNGQPWQVGLQDPEGSKVYAGVFNLKDQAIATSGDYEQFFKTSGKIYNHIFNPKTGYPASSGTISVTVVAEDCLTADALATAISVTGAAEARKLISHFKGSETVIIAK